MDVCNAWQSSWLWLGEFALQIAYRRLECAYVVRSFCISWKALLKTYALHTVCTAVCKSSGDCIHTPILHLMQSTLYSKAILNTYMHKTDLLNCKFAQCAVCKFTGDNSMHAYAHPASHAAVVIRPKFGFIAFLCTICDEGAVLLLAFVQFMFLHAMVCCTAMYYAVCSEEILSVLTFGAVYVLCAVVLCKHCMAEYKVFSLDAV